MRAEARRPFIWVYEKTPNAYKELLKTVGEEVSILSIKTNGYKDISITIHHRDAKGDLTQAMSKAPYKYNGNKYQYAK